MKLVEPGAEKLRDGPKPAHIGIIMDGNGRWASYRGLDRAHGHRAGWDAALELAQAAVDRGIQWITFYAFTAENWKRPQSEVQNLLTISQWPSVRRKTERLIQQNVRIRILGRGVNDDRAQKTEAWLSTLAERTRQNVGANISIAFNYSGQNELRDAFDQMARVDPENLSDLENYLYCPEMPPLDLVIRTGGERRLSNFMLWHCAYAELLFTDTLFPDFTRGHLDSALEDFAFRDRRFGGLSAEVTP